MSEHDQTPDAQLDGTPTADELAPPAPAEAQAPAPEEEGAARSTAPSSEDELDLEDDQLVDDEDAPTRHESSAGFGVVGKFEGARADLERQEAGYHDRWQEARVANGEPATREAAHYTEDRDQ